MGLHRTHSHPWYHEPLRHTYEAVGMGTSFPSLPSFYGTLRIAYFLTITLLMYILIIDEYFYIKGVCYHTEIDHSPDENSPLNGPLNLIHRIK